MPLASPFARPAIRQHHLVQTRPAVSAAEAPHVLRSAVGRALSAVGFYLCIVGGLVLVAALGFALAGKSQPVEPERIAWTASAIQWWVAASLFFSLGIGVCGCGRAVTPAAVHAPAR
jgi:hypothetical protein